jgi:hypothetical protein
MNEHVQNLAELLSGMLVHISTKDLMTNHGYSQATLDAIIVHQPRAPAFTTSGLLDYVVELIVCEDKAFQLVDKGPFRRLLAYLRPNLSDKDIPHRKVVRSEILKKAQSTETRLKEILGVCDSMIISLLMLTKIIPPCRIFLAKSHSRLTLGHPTLAIRFFQ